MRQSKTKKYARQVTCRGKRRYRDHQEATRALHHFAVNGTRDVKPVRAYQCPTCNGWHITSRAEY
jgi:hypothetical protein